VWFPCGHFDEVSFCWVVNANCELLRLAAVKAEGCVCTAAITSFFFF
jgi:hypothetical protein